MLGTPFVPASSAHSNGRRLPEVTKDKNNSVSSVLEVSDTTTVVVNAITAYVNSGPLREWL